MSNEQNQEIDEAGRNVGIVAAALLGQLQGHAEAILRGEKVQTPFEAVADDILTALFTLFIGLETLTGRDELTAKRVAGHKILQMTKQNIDALMDPRTAGAGHACACMVREAVEFAMQRAGQLAQAMKDAREQQATEPPRGQA